MASGTQIAVRLPDEAMDAVDAMVRRGEFGSRAEVLRHAIELLVDARRRAAIGEEIVRGFERVPQTDEEEERAWATLRALVAEEPW